MIALFLIRSTAFKLQCGNSGMTRDLPTRSVCKDNLLVIIIIVMIIIITIMIINLNYQHRHLRCCHHRLQYHQS